MRKIRKLKKGRGERHFLFPVCEKQEASSEASCHSPRSFFLPFFFPFFFLPLENRVSRRSRETVSQRKEGSKRCPPSSSIPRRSSLSVYRLFIHVSPSTPVSVPPPLGSVILFARVVVYLSRVTHWQISLFLLFVTTGRLYLLRRDCNGRSTVVLKSARNAESSGLSSRLITSPLISEESHIAHSTVHRRLTALAPLAAVARNIKSRWWG